MVVFNQSDVNTLPQQVDENKDNITVLYNLIATPYTARGEWVYGEVYNTKDLVYNEYGVYVCKQQVLSLTTPQDDPLYWYILYYNAILYDNINNLQNELNLTGEKNVAYFTITTNETVTVDLSSYNLDNYNIYFGMISIVNLASITGVNYKELRIANNGTILTTVKGDYTLGTNNRVYRLPLTINLANDILSFTSGEYLLLQDNPLSGGSVTSWFQASNTQSTVVISVKLVKKFS